MMDKMDATWSAAVWSATVTLADADTPRSRLAIELARVMDNFRINERGGLVLFVCL